MSAPSPESRNPVPSKPGTGRPVGEVATDGALSRLGIRFTVWAERWFPDAFIFVAIAVVIVALGALANGAPAMTVAKSFGDGFWSLIPFTMQMAFVTIGGYVVATAPPVQRLIDRLALVPKTGRGAVGFVAGGDDAVVVPELGPQPDLPAAFSPARSPAAPNFAWITGPPVPRPISGSAPPGPWGSAHRPPSFRPIRRACRRACCRSPA